MRRKATPHSTQSIRTIVLSFRLTSLYTNDFQKSILKIQIYRLCDELKIRRRSPNKARKTYVSTCINAGMDLDFVREQVGHRDIQTTLNNYTYSTTRDTEKIQQLDRMYGSF